MSCHMPKRRTDDVVHAVVTDHYIQRRRPARNLLAPLPETHDTDRTAYRGEVALFYPRRLPATAEAELYLATAQVTDGANFESGIPRLRKAVETYRPPQAEFYFELANAYSKTHQDKKSIPYYEEALRRDPRFPAARQGYAAALTSLGRLTDAAKALQAAASKDAATLNALGVTYLNLEKLDEAVATLRQALSLDSELPEIYVNLGNALTRKGDQGAAIDAFRNAIQASPASAAAHSNLATVFQAQGDFEQARYHFQKAIWSDPDNAAPHYNYGRALAEKKKLAEAELELEAALKLDPRLAEAAVSLGLVFAQTGRPERAIELYHAAIVIQPNLAAARFNLGLALLGQGNGSEAKKHFETLVQSNPDDGQSHLYLGRILQGEGNDTLAEIHLEKAARSPRPDVRAAALKALHTAREKR
jgi:tetratricopeptide (TPR) repeat protein